MVRSWGGSSVASLSENDQKKKVPYVHNMYITYFSDLLQFTHNLDFK